MGVGRLWFVAVHFLPLFQEPPGVPFLVIRMEIYSNVELHCDTANLSCAL